MAYYNLGNAYFRVGKPDEAIAALKKTVELDPDHADAYNNLGMIYRIKDNRGEAIEMFKKTLEIDPNYARGHYNLAVSYYQDKQYSLAKIHAEKASQLGYKVNPAFLKELQKYWVYAHNIFPYLNQVILKRACFVFLSKLTGK